MRHGSTMKYSRPHYAQCTFVDELCAFPQRRPRRPGRRCLRRVPLTATSRYVVEACLAQMNVRGRIACCGAVSQYDGVPSATRPRGDRFDFASINLACAGSDANVTSCRTDRGKARGSPAVSAAATTSVHRTGLAQGAATEDDTNQAALRCAQCRYRADGPVMLRRPHRHGRPNQYANVRPACTEWLEVRQLPRQSTVLAYENGAADRSKRSSEQYGRCRRHGIVLSR